MGRDGIDAPVFERTADPRRRRSRVHLIERVQGAVTAMITRLSWRYGNDLQYEHAARLKWRTLSLPTRVARWSPRRILRQTLGYDAPELEPSPTIR
ncbi:MAG: hypothetical protein F4Z28_08965 [Gammaproteobacteria bacterium]|nr:hypothetical protein [Gammaproteobacteria bacterium]